MITQINIYVIDQERYKKAYLIKT